MPTKKDKAQLSNLSLKTKQQHLTSVSVSALGEENKKYRLTKSTFLLIVLIS